jgi:hypothetical protein
MLKKIFRIFLGLRTQYNSLYSVVIPTMWGPPNDFILKLLTNLNDCDFIGEIILIDNNKNFSPIIPNFEKLNYQPQESNIYVNPAWNLGVRLARHNKIILCNDDINTDWSELLNFVDNNVLKLKKTKIGIIGLDKTCYGADFSPATNFKFLKTRPVGYGCLMILNKINYSFIPENIKIFSGDTFLFNSCKRAGALNVSINWHKVFTANDKLSLTSRDKDFDRIKEDDVESHKALDYLLDTQSAASSSNQLITAIEGVKAELVKLRQDLEKNKLSGG